MGLATWEIKVEGPIAQQASTSLVMRFVALSVGGHWLRPNFYVGFSFYLPVSQAEIKALLQCARMELFLMLQSYYADGIPRNTRGEVDRRMVLRMIRMLNRWGFKSKDFRLALRDIADGTLQ